MEMSIKNKNILLIGGLGFIGLHLTKNLLDSGYNVTILSPSEEIPDLNFLKKIKLVKGSILNSDILDKLIKDKDVVINLSGFIDKKNLDPIKSFKINCIGELNILESLRKINPKSHHVFLGTRAQFGKIQRNGKLVNENQYQKPNSIYGINKKTCEEYLKYYKEVHSLDILLLRLVGVYGLSLDKKPNHFISKMVFKGLKGKDILINGDGSQIQDFIHINDLINLIKITIENRICGTYNVGNGEGLEMKKIAKYIKEKTGNHSTIKYKSLSLEENYVDLDGCIMDISKISEITGWKPKIDICCGINKVIKEMKNLE